MVRKQDFIILDSLTVGQLGEDIFQIGGWIELMHFGGFNQAIESRAGMWTRNALGE